MFVSLFRGLVWLLGFADFPSRCLRGEVIFGRLQVAVDEVLDLCKEAEKSTAAFLCPPLECSGFSNPVHVQFATQNLRSSEQFTARVCIHEKLIIQERTTKARPVPRHCNAWPIRKSSPMTSPVFNGRFEAAAMRCL
jgi:hypothetical protein